MKNLVVSVLLSYLTIQLDVFIPGKEIIMFLGFILIYMIALCGLDEMQDKIIRMIHNHRRINRLKEMRLNVENKK